MADILPLQHMLARELLRSIDEQVPGYTTAVDRVAEALTAEHRVVMRLMNNIATLRWGVQLENSR